MSCGKHVLTLATINPNVIHMEYAVRGPIVIRSQELERELQLGEKKNFQQVVKCNIGDCHATGQKPITFFRQVIALCSYPPLLEDPNFPEDAKARARSILAGCAGKSVGSYSISIGVTSIRERISEYIRCRDGIPANHANIFLSNGASEAVKAVLLLLSSSQPGPDRAGVMVPIPQYPLYSATISEYDACQINYYLDEDNNWDLKVTELERALTEAKGRCKPRALVVINPGNPTGQVISRQSMEEIIRFVKRHNLVLLADEVYQFNVYHPEITPWTSFKKVLHEMGPEYADSVELASFMSASKGYMGECGFRGGYCELINFDPGVQAQLFKYLSARLCPAVLGQVMIGVICDPPRPSEPSYDLYIRERDSVLADLKEKAQLATDTLNSLEGVTCNAVQGAMYAFPQIRLPPNAIAAAKLPSPLRENSTFKYERNREVGDFEQIILRCHQGDFRSTREGAAEKGMEPDFFYCLSLLEEKGICFVPGSGFGQKAGTYHFRTTILPSVPVMRRVMADLADFHKAFLAKYS
ncbi:Alanine aminotransferase 2 [Echinococcus granulosus]|uniref:alanine transaminase n=1 Tax=Echinococcus granulosus TaxID=6210 RepID=W6UUM9_ECHGR|nr:Alanine aminotransferase 2 [Echinococcus granulosus]EUB57099.1 Alanine aminotransferase 2 [Echinococcus granulosus]